MNATQPAARRLAVPAIVTAAAAAWFVLVSGVALAEAVQPGVAVAAPTPTQITLTPEGTMKLTVLAQRSQTARVHTAAVRKASQG